MPGSASGRTWWNTVCIFDAPTPSAASRIEGGTVLYYSLTFPPENPDPTTYVTDYVDSGDAVILVDGTNRTTTIDELAIILDELTKRD